MVTSDGVEADAVSSGLGPTLPSTRGPWPGNRAVIAAGFALALALGFAIFAVAYRHDDSQPPGIRVTGIPSTVPTGLANLMALSPVPHRVAPDFTLVDQHGHFHSLSGFGGSVVVLEFMDSHCVDICPLVSLELVDAFHDLGTSAARVTFVAVNVNPYNRSVRDVAAFSREHGLGTIPTWHFFTGSLHDLRAVWHAYGIVVEARNRTADVIHSSYVFFIDPQGYERYLGAPMDDHTKKGTAYLPAGQLTSWGRGISLVSSYLTSNPTS